MEITLHPLSQTARNPATPGGHRETREEDGGFVFLTPQSPCEKVPTTGAAESRTSAGFPFPRGTQFHSRLFDIHNRNVKLRHRGNEKGPHFPNSAESRATDWLTRYDRVRLVPRTVREETRLCHSCY